MFLVLVYKFHFKKRVSLTRKIKQRKIFIMQLSDNIYLKLLETSKSFKAAYSEKTLLVFFSHVFQYVLITKLLFTFSRDPWYFSIQCITSYSLWQLQCFRFLRSSCLLFSALFWSDPSCCLSLSAIYFVWYVQ